MVSKLKCFNTKKEYDQWCKKHGYDKRACEKAWIGKGCYYARGKKHISVHIRELDLRRDPPKRKREGVGSWRHMHDLVKFTVKLKKGVKKGVEKRSRRLVELARKKLAETKTRRTHVAVKPTLSNARAFLLNRSIKKMKKHRVLTREAKRLADYLWERIPKKYRSGKDKVWTYISVLALAKAILSKIGKRDWKSIDWEHEIDWSQGYEAAKNYITRILGSKEPTASDVDEYIKYMMRAQEQEPRISPPEEIDEYELRQLFS